MSIEWKGPQDGLPPVGYTQDDCICIFVEHGEFEILAHRDNEAVIYFKDKGSDDWSVDLALPGQFCPIQSERDKAIEEAMSHVRQDWSAQQSVTIGEFVTNAVVQLYDAGYRKPMSRAEARKDLMQKTLLGGHEISAVLDALGYKE